MKGTKKLRLTAAALVVLIIAGGWGIYQSNSSSGHGTIGNASAAANKTITLGYVNWDEDVAVTYLWANLLEKRGYQVNLQILDLGPMYIGLSRGGVDVFFDTWLPEQSQYLNHYASSLVSIGKWYLGGTTEGFVVPQYVTDINSITDLKTHASEFGNQVVGIDAGSVEMQIAQKALNEYGASNLTLVPSSAPAMLATLVKDYQAKKPVVVTLWSPQWAYAKYKLKYLADPKGVWGKAGWIQGEANKTWASGNPQVMKWLENFKLSDNQLETLEDDINGAKTPQAGVARWIQENQQAVNAWFK
jgi:glycine betaine/proline transport system substrate-binding protein